MVLLVEDDPTYPMLVKKAFALEELAEQLHCVATLEEARQVLDTSDQVGVILLDLHLEQTSGLELLDWLREKKLCVPALVHSWSSEPERIAQAYSRGAAGFVPKPQGLTELRKLARNLTGFWLELNRLPARR